MVAPAAFTRVMLAEETVRAVLFNLLMIVLIVPVPAEGTISKRKTLMETATTERITTAMA